MRQALFLLLALAAPAAAELKIAGELKVPANRIVRLSAEGAAEGAACIWDVSDEDRADLEELKGGRLLFTGPAGAYKVKLRAIRLDRDGATQIETARATVVIGDPPPPVPPGPTPPGPTPPGPTPPGPTPGPAPIPEAGLRVLIVYESSELSKLPPAQANVLYARSVRDFLNASCAVGADGKTREWRIWDKDVDPSQESAVWQAAMKRPRASVPWLLVSNGKTGYEGPLPGTADDLLALLKKYATSTRRK
jgi:hypothetical protein